MSSTYECVGIVLKATDAGEADKQVRLLTDTRGLVYAKLRGVKKQTAKLKYASMPFFLGNFIIASKGNVITGASQILDLSNITLDYNKYINACVMLQICDIAGRLDTAQVFVLLLQHLKKMLATTDANYVLKEFLTSILAMLGYADNYTQYSAKGLVSVLEKRLECTISAAALL